MSFNGKTYLFIVALAVCFSFVPTVMVQSAQAGGNGGICLTRPLDLVGVSSQTCFEPRDVDTLMTLPVDLRRSSKLKMTSPQSMSTQVVVRSCSDYWEHQNKGWYALSQRDMDREAIFVKTCGLLSALQNARSAKRSHMRSSDGLAQLNALRPDILMDFVGDTSKIKAARARETLADWVNKGRCTVQEAKPGQLHLTYGNVEAVYTEIARADFNGDGYQDILISAGQKARGGTAGATSLLLLTKTTAKGPYDTLSFDDF